MINKQLSDWCEEWWRHWAGACRRGEYINDSSWLHGVSSRYRRFTERRASLVVTICSTCCLYGRAGVINQHLSTTSTCTSHCLHSASLPARSVLSTQPPLRPLSSMLLSFITFAQFYTHIIYAPFNRYSSESCGGFLVTELIPQLTLPYLRGGCVRWTDTQLWGYSTGRMRNPDRPQGW